jgi:glycosyltransferase involved in cell wall biosynthesis
MHRNGVAVSVYDRQRPAGWPGRERDTEGIRSVFTRGIDMRSSSTLTHGLSAVIHARREPYDAVLVLNVANGFFLPVMRRAGIATVVNVDGIEWERAKWGKAAQKIFKSGARMTAKYADSIVVDSRVIGDLWRALFEVESTFIPYGADPVQKTAAGADAIRKAGLVPGSYVLGVARLVPENNVEVLLNAMQMLGPEVPVVVVGRSHGPSPLEERLARLDANSNQFRWLGHVEDQEFLGQLWAHCRVYVHGHSVGGTNPALLQAMACGAPVFALDTPFNREVLGDTAAGFFEPHAEDLLRLLGEMIADPAGTTFNSGAARARVAAHYDWNDICSRYAIALERAVAGKS